jgi:hypothetical protein
MAVSIRLVFSFQLSAVSFQLSAFSSQQSAVSFQLSAVSSQQSAFSSQLNIESANYRINKSINHVTYFKTKL